MKGLEQMIGESFVAIVPFIDKNRILSFKLLGVEFGGLWVESQDATNMMLGKLNLQAAPKTAVLFIPYHQIVVGFSSIDSPALSEESFGMTG
jgi:hypothetical protein